MPCPMLRSTYSMSRQESLLAQSVRRHIYIHTHIASLFSFSNTKLPTTIYLAASFFFYLESVLVSAIISDVNREDVVAPSIA